MKKLITLLLIVFAFTSYSQIQVNETVTLKGSEFQAEKGCYIVVKSEMTKDTTQAVAQLYVYSSKTNYQNGTDARALKDVSSYIYFPYSSVADKSLVNYGCKMVISALTNAGYTKIVYPY